MKKILLTLLLLFSLSLAASAETIELFDVTPANSFSKSGSASATESTLTINGREYTVYNVWWQKSTSNSYMAFKKDSDNTPYMILPVLEGKIVTKVGLYLPTTVSAKNAKFNIYVNGVKAVDTFVPGKQSEYVYTEIPVANQAAGATIKIESANTGNQIGFGKLSVDVIDAVNQSTIDLDEANLEVKYGDTVVEGDEVTVPVGTVFTWSYKGASVSDEIAYSYETETSDGKVEGNTYTFDGAEGVVQFYAESNNEISKIVQVYKVLPTYCPKPTISLKETDTEVFAGMVVTIDGNEADKTEWTVNGTPIEGTSYTITEAEGTELKFVVTNTTKINNEGQVENATEVVERTVMVVEKHQADFDFNQNGAYGLTTFSSGTDYEENVTEIVEGICNIGLEGTYRLWKKGETYELRMHKNDAGNGAMTVSVPDGYYIESIEFAGNNINKFSVSKGRITTANNISTWTCESLTSSVKFTAATDRVDVYTMTVKYQARQVLGMDYKISINEKTNMFDIDYTIHIQNHKEGDVYKLRVAFNDEEPEDVELDVPVAGAQHKPASGNIGTADGATAVITGTHSVAASTETDTQHNIRLAVLLNDQEVHSTETPVVYTVTTGIEDVVVEGGEAAEYYNLQGVRVAQPEAGRIYIVRRGGKAVKELVK